jgi:CRISPR/Cas system Type II protein with McrA/HNH and RuvC-like nuclease domain
MTEANDATMLIKSWTPVITIAGGAVAFIVGLWKYSWERAESHRWKEFEVFHKLVKELVEPAETKPMYIDRQSAVVYELMHFKRYYPYTLRMLRGLRDQWSKEACHKRLIDEIDVAIEFLDSQTVCRRTVE